MSIRNLVRIAFLSLCCSVTAVQVVQADLYKCGEIWSTSPCGDGSDPVNNLPAVRGEDKKQPSESSDYVPQINPMSDLCSAAGSKQLRIEHVMVNAEGESFSLDISIRNAGRKNFSRPLYVRITDPQHSISIVRLLTKYIPHNSSDIFSISLRGLAPKWYFGTPLAVQLLYAKTAACVIRQVELPASQYRLRNKYARQTSFSIVEANSLLTVLREEQEELYAALPRSSTIEDPFLLLLLLYKAESALIRRSHYCSAMRDSSLIYRCGVLANDLASAVQHIQGRIPK